MKELRNVFEEMMRKGSEEKIEKRGNEKGARRKIYRRKDISDNKTSILRYICNKEDSEGEVFEHGESSKEKKRKVINRQKAKEISNKSQTEIEKRREKPKFGKVF